MADAINWNEYLSTRTENAYTDRELVKPYLKGDVLEVGSGFGDFAGWCARELGCRVSGIDPSAEAIAQAARNYPEGRFVVGHAEQLPYPDRSFDVVVSLEVVEHLPQPELFFSEARRVLRPGGWLIVQTPNYPIKRCYDFLYWLMGRKKNAKDDPTHVSPFTFRRMRKLVQVAGFTIEHLVGRNIAGEKRWPFLARWKRGALAPLFVQKMILVARLASS